MTTDRYARSDFVDWQRSTYLGNGCRAAAAVQPDGQTGYWIVSPDAAEHHTGCACPHHAPHEQDGPLPPPYRDRLNAVPICCGAPTLATGRPCRIPVTRPGDRCHHHRNRRTSP